MQSSTPTPITPAQHKLVEMISKIFFGHIERFPVRNGEPVLDPEPVVVIYDKIGTPSCKSHSAFTAGKLKPSYLETLHRIEHLGDGTIELIEIKHGQPFLMKRTSTKRS